MPPGGVHPIAYAIGGHGKAPFTRRRALKNPPCGRVGLVKRWSVGSAALESFEHQIAHCPYIGLEPLQTVGTVVAILGALTVDAVTYLAEFAIQGH
jgi:hypothetical protein